MISSGFLLRPCKNFIKQSYKHNWIKPDGFETGIQVYNCITEGKTPLILKNKQLITWYTCGPTVYDTSHIGHACCYVKLDVIQRILKSYFKYNIVMVMNITDIDDKIIYKANQTNTLYKDVATRYEKEFLKDLQDLGVTEPNIILRVTENIELIIDFIKKLEDGGQAYKAKDNSVYFDVKHYNNYGKLQNIGDQMIQQEQNDFKKSSADFALWKGSKKGEPFWHSPWGTGRPGWHIECSALASHILGSNIDIHAGGLDLRFPHHENEEAQSCAYHKTNQWVNYWLHTGHLHLKSAEKMSKSLKNTISIQEMLKIATPDVFRLSCLMSHYRSNVEYSKELLETAENLLKVYKNLLNSCDDYKKGYLKATINTEILTQALNDAYDNIHRSLCDDFDTPAVIKCLNDLVSVTNSMLHATVSSNSDGGLYTVMGVANFVSNTLSMFGINFESKTHTSQDFTEIMDILNTFRQNVRLIGVANKDQEVLKLCDNVRIRLRHLGIDIKDHAKASSWSR
ncbi:hypothetical protein NQ317_014445 [Molorchus minor]|uniref:cysteine--tRNA ligase n=1 Tax=Molorchus minor TaxID=1323400 RepID=A0ABQ9K5A4_9CUCU|nr:hypothetical protein NQ317_014445 [Molorchus minor]